MDGDGRAAAVVIAVARWWQEMGIGIPLFNRGSLGEY